MPSYRYYTIPIIVGGGTNAVVELELSGVNMDKQLNGAGNFQGTFRLVDDSDVLNTSVLNGTVPGYHAFVVKRDDVPIWAGPIWSRTYESEGQTIGFTAQTFESVFARTPLVADFVSFTGAASQTVIVNNLVNQFQAQSSGANNYGFVTSHDNPNVGARTIAIPATDNKTADDVLSQLVDVDDGLVYTINLTGTADAPVKTIQTYWTGASFPASTLALDYPGTLSQYWFTESAAKGGVRHVVIASNNVSAVANSNMAIQPPGSGYPTTTWPQWLETQSLLNINDMTILTSKARQQALIRQTPMPEPIFELTDTATEVFTHWNDLGRTIVCRLEDPRFPASISITSQLAGWSLRPESTEGPEVIRLQIVGDS